MSEREVRIRMDGVLSYSVKDSLKTIKQEIDLKHSSLVSIKFIY